MAIVALAGCRTAPGVKRPESSVVGCVRAVVQDKVPREVHDKQAHCLAAGFITRYCSVSEAYVAGLAKEIGDLLGRGDASAADLSANRSGIRCARSAATDDDVRACCRDALDE